MTVCIAAITERNSVIGVSDRMLTAGDIEFEPQQMKVWPLSRSIYALIAGDATLQAEIMKRVENDIVQRITNAPTDWIPIREAAELYCKEYKQLLRQNAEADILQPVGMDLNTFLAQQKRLNTSFVTSTAEALRAYAFESELETIFLGIDTEGPSPDGKKMVYPHIYVTRDGKSHCYDNVGFAAIGIGKNHAESQFMFSGYWRGKPNHEAAFIAYAAKKRAEVAPGVGVATDVVVVGPGLGSSFIVDEKHVNELDKYYRQSKRSADTATRRAFKKTEEYLKRQQAGLQSQGQQQAKVAVGPKPSNAQKSKGQP